MEGGETHLCKEVLLMNLNYFILEEGLEILKMVPYFIYYNTLLLSNIEFNSTICQK